MVGSCTFIILFGLLQVTQVAVNITKVIVAHCHIKMVRVELFQINSKCTFIILFGLLQPRSCEQYQGYCSTLH